MKKLKLFFACLLMAVLSIGQVWGAVYFEDTFSDVGTGSSGSMLPRDGWSGSGTTAPQYNTGVRLGASSSGATLTKVAMSNIEGTKSLKVTIYVSRYNTNANTLTVTATNGTIASATLAENVSTGSELNAGTLTIKPSANAGVTSTTAAATWTDAYKTEFTITGASSSTTIAFASDKRLILGPVKIEDAASTPSTCTSEITITKADNPENGTFAIDNSGTVCIDEENATVTVTATPAAHYHLASVTSTVGTIGSIAGNTCEITDIDADTEIGVAFAENDKYQVTWNVNGNEDTKTNVYAGEKPVFPATPESCDATSTTFIGWAAAPWTGKLADLSEKTVYMSASAMPDVDAAVTYYAVFAKAGGSASELFSWAGGTKAGLTAAEGVAALTADNSDYAESHAPYRVKWNTDKMHIIISVASQPGKVSAGFKKIGGAGVSTITVQESTATDGTFTDVETLSIEGASNAIVSVETSSPFQSTTRAIKLVYNKQANVGLGPISIEGAVSYEDYMTTCTTPTVAKPTISGETSFLSSTEVTLAQAAADAIYYTIDNSTPTDASTPYSAPFTLTNSATVKAIAVKGGVSSAVAEETFTKVTVLTVAEARAAIDAGGDLSNKYVAGIISQIDSYNGTYHSITYWISDDGTTEDQLEVYGGLAGVVKTQFASKDDLAVGDDVTVNGTLKKYNSIYEFDKDNIVVAYKPIARLAWAGTTEGAYNASLEGENTFPTLTNTNSVTVAYSSSDESAATINPSTGAISLEGVGTTTITASFVGNETYKANSVSYTLNVASSVVHATISFNVDGGDAIADLTDRSALPMELPVATKAGKNFGGWFTDSDKEVAAVPGAAITENITLYAKWLDPYTITEAKAVIDANASGIANQYVAGIISQIDSYQSSYHSITYWISADGTTTNQLQVYSGLIGNAATALGKEQFTAKTDLELGDEVVVTGTLKLHNSTTYEFDKNNTIYTFSRKASAGLEYAVTAVNKVVGDADFVNELTNPISVAVTYATSDDQVAEVASDGTVTIIGEGTATISATFAGNETYKAAVVSYTLTVSATVDTRHIANSPAEFASVSGNMSPDDIAYASYKGGAGNDPFITSGKAIRLYQISGTNDFGGFITLTAKAGCTIDEVQITTTSSYSTTVAYSKDGNENLLKSESVSASGSYTTGTGLNVSSVNILNLGTGSSGRLEIASIKVYYTGEPAAIDHYELGGTYQTAFMQNEEFNHTGLIVYAAYDALGEIKVDITSMCTFSEPDMSTTGEKTIEITYNEAVVISYTINVAADSRKVAESPATFTAVSGDMVPADITFASYKGGASNDPYLATGGIRLYQINSTNNFGGFITLKAKKGCTIDQVKITTSAEYATTVAYSVDGNENLLGSESVAKSSSYTTPAGLNVESVNILNLGTGSNGRLEIASIKVWYTGDPLAVDHYILGGTYATEFEQYGEFNYEGLTVTAAYDAGETITEAVVGFTVEADLSTAGPAKANVMLNSVKIAEYDITVTASAKEDPALAYIPASVILTFGQSLTAPEFSNTHNVSPISYNSDKPAVATVDAEGNIALAGGTGVAVITASFAGNDDYIESEATFTITVNEPAEDLTGPWTLASTVAAGDKIIIGATKDANTYAMGKQNSNNRAAVASTLEGATLTPGAATKVFTLVDAGEGKFAILASNGKYLTSATSGSSNNLLEADNYDLDNAKWTISIDGEGIASVVAAAGSKTVMQYNAGSTLFSCYGSASQTAINIYKKGTPDYGSYQRTITKGNYGTICLPKAGVISGAKLYEVAYFDGSLIYVDEILNGVMVAGRPYLFFATSEQLNVTYTSDVEADAGNHRGLVGSFTQEEIEANAENYILYNNQYWLVNSLAYVGANRAYISMADVPSTPQTGDAPGRRRVSMKVNGPKVPTGFENIDASETPMKLMIDGQIYILRGEKMYDTTGRLVK